MSVNAEHVEPVAHAGSHQARPHTLFEVTGLNPAHTSLREGGQYHAPTRMDTVSLFSSCHGPKGREKNPLFINRLTDQLLGWLKSFEALGEKT